MSSTCTVEAMRADAPAGCCIVCERKLPKSKGKKPRSTLCGERACFRVYSATRKADMRAAERERLRIQKLDAVYLRDELGPFLRGEKP